VAIVDLLLVPVPVLALVLVLGIPTCSASVVKVKGATLLCKSNNNSKQSLES
jgi:hypothetical protein